MAASQVMRITLKAYDHQLIDASAKSIIKTVKTGTYADKEGNHHNPSCDT